MVKKLFFGGDILTMVNKEDEPEAVFVEDGKIRYVGRFTKAAQLAGAEAEQVDLNGRTLMPSFIDGHSHISLYARFAEFPDLSDCISFADIVGRLKEELMKNPVSEDGILFAVNYDHNFLNEGRHPNRKLLDQVSEKIPIWIYHTSGHMGVANSRLLTLSGINSESPDPDGGHLGRFEDGSPDGYIEEIPALMPVLLTAFSRIQADAVQQMADVQDVYLKYGVTTVQDGSSNSEGIAFLKSLAEQKLLRVDVVAYPMYTDHPADLLKQNPEMADGYYNRLKIGGGKILLDGSPQARTAWLSESYEGDEEYCGYAALPDTEVESAIRDAEENGYQLLAHANGDAAAEQYLRCYEKVLRECGLKTGSDHKTEINAENRRVSGYAHTDRRPVMVHCQTVRDDQLKKMAELGMIPSIFVAHTYFWGDVHLKNLGKKRGNHISPVKSALAYGLPYNFHQDCPILPPDMLRTVWCAVNRKTRGGILIGEDQRISVFDALKGITIHAAYEYFEEDQKGSIEVGKLADLVILDQNPLKVEREKLADIRILETMKEGEVLYRGQIKM